MTEHHNSEPLIVYGESGKEFARGIHTYLEKAAERGLCNRFHLSTGTESISGTYADGEAKIEIADTVIGRDVYVVQCPSATRDGSYDMEVMYLLNDAARRADANKVVNAIGNLRGQREDRRSGKRRPIAAKRTAAAIENSGASGVMTFHVHNPAIEGYFDRIPFTDITTIPYYLRDAKQKFGSLDNVVLVGLDPGGVKYVTDYLKAKANPSLLANLNFAFAVKLRFTDEDVAVTNFIGDIDGRNVISIDDEMATWGTNDAVLRYMYGSKVKGEPKSVTSYGTRPKFCGPAGERMERARDEFGIDIVTTNVMPLTPEYAGIDGLRVLDVSPAAGEVFRRIEMGESVSDFMRLEEFDRVLFDELDVNESLRA